MSLQYEKENEAYKDRIQQFARKRLAILGGGWGIVLFIGAASDAATFWIAFVIGLIFMGTQYNLIRAAFKRDVILDKPVETTHGSATWAGLWDLIEMDAFKPKGAKAKEFALATVRQQLVDEEPQMAALDRRVRVPGHVVTVAPTGTGKGIGCVIPTLLEYAGSAIVIDVKGENAAVTARARAAMGQAIYTIDPYGVTGQTRATYNPLNIIDTTNPDCVAASSAIADALVMVNPSNGVDHFDETARKLIQGLILYICTLYPENLRTLGEVRRALTLAPDMFKGMIEHMSSDESIAYAIPSRVAALVLSVGERELGSILSTAQRHTEFLDDPRICEALGNSDHAADLRRVKHDLMTVYIVLPAHVIRQNARLLRLFVGGTMQALTAEQGTPETNVALILDEFAQLGYLKAIEDNVSLLRSYGVNFWLFLQDLSQLQKTYPRWQTFLANSTKQFFGCSDVDTAKYISESLGQYTQSIESQSHSRNHSPTAGPAGGTSSSSTSHSHIARALLTPDEVMRLDVTKAIVLIKHKAPIMATKINYLTDPEYVGLADPNPFH